MARPNTLAPTPRARAANDWDLETALDVQWAHAMAPAANILLVEANSSAGLNDLMTAVDYARDQPGVSVVSMSLGRGRNFGGENSLDFHFTTPANHSGVTFVTASGDSGGPGYYPGLLAQCARHGRHDGLTLNGQQQHRQRDRRGWSGSSIGGGISRSSRNRAGKTASSRKPPRNGRCPTWLSSAEPVHRRAGLRQLQQRHRHALEQGSVGGTSLAAPAWAALVAIANQGRNLAGLPTMDTAELMSRDLLDARRQISTTSPWARRQARHPNRQRSVTTWSPGAGTRHEANLVTWFAHRHRDGDG